MLNMQQALIHTMVVVAEADHDIADAEIGLIGDLVNHLPIFRGLDRATMTEMAMHCSEMLLQAGGSDRVFAMVREALPMPLRETAYALACDVVAVDGRLNKKELEVLERVRSQLEVDPAMARAIEQVTRVRFQAA